MELTIEKLVYGGDGLARIESADGRRKTVFVPLVLPGERVEVTLIEERPGFARARLDKTLEPSLLRTPPPCPYFGECGGCHYQHTSYENQLQLKANILRETVARISKIELPELQSHPSQPSRYRNRTRMKVAPDGGQTKFEIGYYRMGSHELLPVRECPISSELINRGVAAMWQVASTHELPPGLAEMEFFVNAEDDALLIELLVERETPELKSFAESLKRVLPQIVGVASVSRQRYRNDESVAAPELSSGPERPGRAVVDEAALRYRVGEFNFQVGAGAFFQTNRFLTQELMAVATGGVSGKLAMDLYAGVGLFTLPLAKSFERVAAVEASPVSFRDLQANVPRHVKTIESTTEAFLARSRGSRPDFVVVDPPRAGLGKRVVEGLAKLGSPAMTYVSCDPSTLARDLPGLTNAGYRITQAHLVDLFPQTFHIETVLRLER